MANVKTFKINDEDVSGREDETILQIARENDIFIPTLCNMEGLSPVGACRLCLVEIKGWTKLAPACVTLCQEGLEVYTDSERLQEYRRMIVELMFSEGNHVCAVCVSNGRCELQDMAGILGMNHLVVPYRRPNLKIDASHERFINDQNRCILCTRCVRVCDEIEGAHTWDVMGRGIEACVITDLHEPWGDSQSCTTCGKCVQICPTGALFEKGKSVAEMSKKREFLPYLTSMRSNDGRK